jgi:hypothetical protein
MPRFSQIQHYADNTKGVRSIPYEQAAGSAEVKKGKVQVEKVVNPYGSVAGAGSGEFHVYRHARAREMQRWKVMDTQAEEMEKDEGFEQNLLKNKREEERKTAKRRRKRQREKEARLRKKNLAAVGVDTTVTDDTQNNQEEFTYTPLEEQTHPETEYEKVATDVKADDKTVPLDEIPNDGSFLEMMKKRLAEDSKNKVSSENKDEPDESLKQPPAKKLALESRMIDEDDEGPMLPPGF